MIGRHGGSFATRHLKVSGYDVVEETMGAEGGQAIVLVHGIGVSSNYFEEFATALATDYYVIMLDLPGYGDAKQPARDLPLGELAAVLNDYLRGRNLMGVIGIGHSMGSQIVVRAAADEKELYKKVIVMSPTVNIKERTFWLQAWRLMQDIPRERAHTIGVVLADYIKMGLVSYIKVTRYMLNDKIEQHMEKIRVPVLVAQGARDPIVPRGWAEFLCSRAAHGELAVIKRAPHNFQCTYPEETARLCKDFITD